MFLARETRQIMTGVASALEHEHRFPFPPNSNAMFYTHVACTFLRLKKSVLFRVSQNLSQNENLKFIIENAL